MESVQERSLCLSKDKLQNVMTNKHENLDYSLNANRQLQRANEPISYYFFFLHKPTFPFTLFTKDIYLLESFD
jgi:hypothetical protein